MTTKGGEDHLIRSREISIKEHNFLIYYNTNYDLVINYYNKNNIEEIYQIKIKKNILFIFFEIDQIDEIYSSIINQIQSNPNIIKKTKNENSIELNLSFNGNKKKLVLNITNDICIYRQVFKFIINEKEKELKNIKYNYNQLDLKYKELLKISNKKDRELNNLERKYSNILSVNNESSVVNNNFQLFNIRIQNKNNIISINDFNFLYQACISINDKKLDLCNKSRGNELLEDLCSIKFDSLEEMKLLCNQISNINPIKEMRLENLHTLDLNDNNIENISPLENVNLNQLKILNLQKNKIIDIKPLKNLNCINLETLRLNNNKIKDISPFSEVKFKNLKILYLFNNNIIDISVFNNAPFKNNLEMLSLYNNNIENFNVLENLRKLKSLYLYNNNFDKNNNKGIIEKLKNSIDDLLE